MKHIKSVLLAATLCLSLTGCGLIPKRVEFFQDKVKAVPQITEAEKEHQKQAAQYVADQIEVAKTVAVANGAAPEVIGPVDNANNVAHSLSTSLGPPLNPWPDTSTNLVNALNHDGAKYQQSLDKYAKDVQKDVGHKIEGTGLFSFSYFTYVGIILLLGAIAWFAIKVWGMVNPAVGLGANTVGSVASSVVSKAFSEVVAGGEAFKTYLANSNLSSDVKDYVSSLFVQAHTSNQSQDVQKLITTLTANPAGVVAPPLSPAPVAAAVAKAPAPVVPPVVVGNVSSS